MHAEPDDTRHHRSKRPWLTAILTGIAAMLLHLPEPSAALDVPASSPSPGTTAYPTADHGIQPHDPAPSRQTVFNDHNYRPRQIVNRLPPTQSTSAARQTTKQSRVRSARWSWKNRQAFENGTFQWREYNGRIDYASVCMNEKEGSLRYRDCRKGARIAFARLCKERHDQAACHAQNNYSPLR